MGLNVIKFPCINQFQSVECPCSQSSLNISLPASWATIWRLPTFCCRFSPVLAIWLKLPFMSAVGHPTDCRTWLYRSYFIFPQCWHIRPWHSVSLFARDIWHSQPGLSIRFGHTCSVERSMYVAGLPNYYRSNWYEVCQCHRGQCCAPNSLLYILLIWHHWLWFVTTFNADD